MSKKGDKQLANASYKGALSMMLSMPPPGRKAERKEVLDISRTLREESEELIQRSRRLRVERQTAARKRAGLGQ